MRKTSEFDHYDGCGRKDPDNCSACALTDTKQDEPNYSAWPLAYMENGRVIPAKWKSAFLANLNSENRPYALNLKRVLKQDGARFSDGTQAQFQDANTVIITERIR